MFKPELGDFLRIIDINSASATISLTAPTGEKGDRGLVNFIGTNHFRMLTEDGGTRCYPLASETKVLSIKTLTSSLRMVLKDQYNRILSKGKNITMGSDPEIFVTHPDGTVIPAWEFLPKSPDHTPKYDNRHGHCDAGAFWDGVQAEFTTIPNACLAYHVDSIYAGLKAVLAAAQTKFPDAVLSTKPVIDVPQKILDGADMTWVMLGCAPSTNVYPDVQPIDVGNPRNLKIRFAGGHLHLGQIIKGDLLNKTVKMLDSIVAVCITAALDGLDDPIRRKYYGRAGEFRCPPHGLEYRTLPSTILVHPALTHIAFDLARQTMWSVQNGYYTLWDCPEAEARAAVDNSDYKLARKIVRRNIQYLRAVLMSIYSASVGDPTIPANNALRIILEGIRNIVPVDIELNWKLKPGFDWIKHSESPNSSVCNLNLT